MVQTIYPHVMGEDLITKAQAAVLTASALPGNYSISTSNLAEGIRSHSSRKGVKDDNSTAVHFLIVVLCDVDGAPL